MKGMKKMRKYPRFVTRKIKDGRVKIYGRWFKPEEKWQKYDGRLDGMKYAFGLYLDAKGNIEDFVYMWGTEEAYRYNGDDFKGAQPEIMPDGGLPWSGWNVEK